MNKKNYDIVAITACPTGIAHTFMAAQALEDSAKALGYTVKIETQGTEGSQNTLTDEDIKNAKAIILAVDKNIELGRFDGLKVRSTSTSKVIKNADLEITNAVQNKGTKMISASSDSKKESSGEGQLSFEDFGGRIWKSIMTGVSYMLPFVVFGGILISISFLIDIGNADAGKDFGTVNDVARWFNTAGGLAMGMMVPILGAYISYGMVGKMGLLPGFIVGLMSRGDFTNTLSGGNDAWYAPVSGISSGFIGAIFGAILVSAIVIVTWKLMVKLPKQFNGIKTILLIPLITGISTVAIFWIVNIPLIYLAWGLTEFLGLFENNMSLAWILGLIIGLMMAIDMGGPINKTAYIVGVTSLETAAAAGETGTVTMAIVMAAGMVPPLATAFATTMRKRNWDKDDIEAGYSNWVLGASFISEGAIPFAAKYPKSVMPGILVGSAITGMLVGIFQITLGAPHGGVMVFALVNTSFGSLSGGAAIAFSVIMYILCIAIGAVIGGLIINYLMSRSSKKTLVESQSSAVVEEVKKAVAKPKVAVKTNATAKYSSEKKESNAKIIEKQSSVNNSGKKPTVSNKTAQKISKA